MRCALSPTTVRTMHVSWFVLLGILALFADNASLYMFACSSAVWLLSAGAV